MSRSICSRTRSTCSPRAARSSCLPKGATVIDFAYAVHSDVGNQCVAARVDRRLAPLRTQLRNGQTVEIITKPNSRPNPAWLDFVVTGKARATIRSFLKRLEHKEAVELGRRLLERELKRWGASSMRSATRSDAAAGRDWLGSFDQLLEQIGLGNRMCKLVARMLVVGRARHLTPRTGRRIR